METDLISMITTNTNIDTNLDRTLRKFWEIESVPNSKSSLSPEETFCEYHFTQNIKISNEGRFTVCLPFKKSPQTLGKSLNLAIQRLRSIERRFIQDPGFFKLYQDFMLEYQRLQHMEEVPHTEVNDSSYYLPHHGILKQSSATTKLRVVFDGSAKTSSGISLNDCLAIGPTVQATLYSIIMRFREHKFVVTADVEKMYRQVKIAGKDTNFQRIVWRNHPSEPIRHFRLTTITYGISSASFLATRSLKKIADDYQLTFPAATNAIRHDIYVDDLMTGASTEAEVIQLKNSISRLLSKHGFILRKWTSNSNHLLDTQIDEINLNVKNINDDHDQQDEIKSIKILGLNWNPTTDQFSFMSNLPNKNSFTKRSVVSEASRLFDPLGWLAPVIVMVKIFIQKLWVINLDWDEPLPDEISKKWQTIRNELENVKIISIPRFIQTTKHDIIQIHGFSDASQTAYGAVVFLRVETATGNIHVNIITSKTKVAPIKQVTLPRLELCAAVLLANLINLVQSETQLSISQVYAWTDSRIVLDWLSSHPRRWSTFVGNRTAEILTTLSRKQWQHVPSSDNPADCASRGLPPSELSLHRLWWNGPDWLQQHMKYWPSQQTNYGYLEEENKKLCTFTTTINNIWFDELMSRYSSWPRLQRVLAYVLRYIQSIKSKGRASTHTAYLKREELFNSLRMICQHEQIKFYAVEKKQLQSNQEISNSSSLKPLNPFVDNFGLIRVGGRLENSEAPFSTKHPIIMHPKSQLTTLILRDIHISNKHSGPSLTLAIARQNYWIPNGRNIVRQTIGHCIICAKFKAKIKYQLMGSLPNCRVELVRPFLKIGVDYAGPIPIHLRKGRGQKVYKSYICLFICLSTKAIHMELVSDLTSDAFLGALKRFVARRGICKEIYSDNGTNFIGANNQLKDTFNKLIKSSKPIVDYSSRQYISWHFIPPNAPHFGGIWEAGIKAAKFHIKRVIGSTILTIEEMGTLLAEIESILNSRPICALQSTDIDVLTPSHFLIGHASTKVPEVDITDINPSYLTRWRVVQQLSQHFWKRWNIEYLTSLQPRAKWRENQTPIRIDDIVVIKDSNTAVSQWALGRVIKVQPGSDGVIRVVTLKTKSGEVIRPTAKLCILPIPREDDSTVHLKKAGLR